MRRKTIPSIFAVLFCSAATLSGCSSSSGYDNFWEVEYPGNIRVRSFQTYGGWSGPLDNSIADVDATNVKIDRIALQDPASSRIYGRLNSTRSIPAVAYTIPYKNSFTPCAAWRINNLTGSKEPYDTLYCDRDMKIPLIKITLLKNMYEIDQRFMNMSTRPRFQQYVLTHELMHALGFYVHDPGTASEASTLDVHPRQWRMMLSSHDTAAINSVYPTPFP